MIGGFDGKASTNAVVVFDVLLDRWRAVSPMPTRRRLLKVTELGGRLFAIGGIDDTGAFLRTVERYDPDADRWQTVAPMTTGRGNSAASRASRGTHAPARGWRR